MLDSGTIGHRFNVCLFRAFFNFIIVLFFPLVLLSIILQRYYQLVTIVDKDISVELL